VPPQHMYGTETSVLLPLLAGMAVHSARPLFATDVAVALSEVPEPRVLVTTPVHLRTLLASKQSFPKVAVVVSTGLVNLPLLVGLSAADAYAAYSPLQLNVSVVPNNGCSGGAVSAQSLPKGEQPQGSAMTITVCTGN